MNCSSLTLHSQTFLDDFARSIQDRLLGKDVQAIVIGKEAHAYYERLLSNKDVPLEKLESSVQSSMTASVSNQGQGASLPFVFVLSLRSGSRTDALSATAAAHVINFFLDDKNSAHKVELVRLCLVDTPEADKEILVRSPFSLASLSISCPSSFTDS